MVIHAHISPGNEQYARWWPQFWDIVSPHHNQLINLKAKKNVPCKILRHGARRNRIWSSNHLSLGLPHPLLPPTLSSKIFITVLVVIHSFTGAYSPGRTFGLPFGVSWSHTYRHTVGLLWTSDQPAAEISTYTGQHNIDTRDKHPCPERESNRRPQQPSGRRPMP
jgi:hypothetical protein